MKMGAGLFWGIVLIAIGLSIIFKVVFDINIMRIIIAVFFILIGIKMLIGKSAINIRSGNDNVFFNERKFTEFPAIDKEYNTIFGKSVFNFNNAAIPTDKTLDLEFNTFFGHTKVILPSGLPVRVQAEAVFGSVSLPNDITAAFGSANYISDHDSSLTNFINIKSNTVFGNTEIIQKRPKF